MKILMLNYEFPPIGGGGGQAHRALVQQYAGRPDLEVDVVTSAPKPGVFMEQMADNVLIFKVGIRKKNLHFWRRREVMEWLLKAGECHRRLVKTGDYDLVHAFFGFPTGWLCYKTARRAPYIISLRGSDVPGANARLKFEYKILGPLVFKPIWKRASALVACSEGLKQRALKFLPSAEIQVIPNGVDLDVFHPAQRAEESSPDKPSYDTSSVSRFKLQASTLHLLTVGRLSATKRLPLLIDAISILRSQGCKVHLTMVGGGALESQLRRLLSEKNLRDAVTLLGRRGAEEMPQLYRQHDVYVSATAQEGMSNAMLEAMASGLPVVTTRCEGVDELISDNGVVVESNEPADLAQAIQRVAGDSARFLSMSVAARKQAERFSWGAVADRYLALYRQIRK
ncbi:MAG: glycosyltransferase family 4 protein [Phycisphaerales bacterium]